MHDLSELVRPSVQDIALLGGQARLYCLVRLANAVVFALGLAVVVTGQITASAGASPTFAHWPSHLRSLTVVDRTGDPAWREATQWAVARWNDGQTGVTLRWREGAGPCRYDGSRIGVCEASYQELGVLGRIHLQGRTDQQKTGDNHAGGAVIRVCSNCELSPSRQRTIVTHELGHALGLAHSDRRGSVMYHAGGPESPDGADYAALRRKNDHRDRRGGEGCVLNGWLRLGPFCL